MAELQEDAEGPLGDRDTSESRERLRADDGELPWTSNGVVLVWLVNVAQILKGTMTQKQSVTNAECDTKRRCLCRCSDSACVRTLGVTVNAPSVSVARNK